MSFVNQNPKGTVFRKPRRAFLALGISLLMLLASAPLANAATGTLPPLGMSVGSIAPLTEAGAPPRYASYWAGDWLADSGWGGFDNAMRTAKAAGVTPVVYWYYWGDSISPSCVDNGCNGRNRAEWLSLTDQLAAHLTSTLGGAEALVVLENEFNKGGITGDYAPTFDTRLEGVAKTLNEVDGVRLILGFGNWGEDNWDKFPKSAAQSDFIGFQMMRASTRDTEAEYRSAATRTVELTNFIAAEFNKPSFLYDVALSSYPDANWAKLQAETLDAIFAGLKTSGATGLQGVVYRSVDDHYMSPSNYYGYAESHWGLRTKDGTPKPAFNVWLEHAKAQTEPQPQPEPAQPNVPGSFEAESMAATKGGRATSASASGGAYWNLWSNGDLSTTLVTQGAYGARIRVTAAGQIAGGVAPTMEIRLGGTLLATHTVPAGFTAYTADVVVPAGSSQLRVIFTNDAVVNGEDRNLLVDVVSVGARPANQPPTASFTHGANGLTASFDGRGSSDPEGALLSYAWDFGDGAKGTGAAPSHAYAAAGTYRVTLTVSDGQLSSSANADITVAKPNQAPVARATAVGSNDTYSFDASGSSDPDGDALTYAWAFGDGATATGARPAAHTYANPGTYTAKVTVTDARGLASTASVTVNVVKPVLTFAATFSEMKGNSYWVQTDVDGNKDVKSVCATVNGGACKALTLRSYGWAASFYVPTGATVVFRATATTGETVTSGGYKWPDATPVASPSPSPSPAPSTPKATFTPYDGNAWWVQTKVDSSLTVKSVCASVNGATCKALSYRSWGAWANGMSAPTGSKVVFSATLSDGSVVKSTTYTWPVE